MGDIYGNAVLTISATNASHVGFGCLNDRPPTRIFKNRLKHSAGDPTQILVREPNSHINLIASPRAEEDAPLHRRAWTAQERFLSTRILHFTAGELVWECASSASCECGHMDTVATPRLRFEKASLAKLSLDERARAWDELALESYQNRHLSQEKDRFPALSGLAQRFYADGLGKYVAGLWSNYALSMLLWEVKTGKKSADYVAPSWSWASVQGKLTRNDAIAPNGDFEAKFEEVECEYASNDKYGAIKDASITITTPIAEALLSTGGHHSDMMILFNAHVRAFFVRDSDEDGVLFGEKIKCAFLRGLTTRGKYVEGLILVQIASSAAFRRIGIAHLTKASLPHLSTLTLTTERVTVM